MTDEINKAINHWEVGNVKITRVIELEHVSFPPGFLFDGLIEDRAVAGKFARIAFPRFLRCVIDPFVY